MNGGQGQWNTDEDDESDVGKKENRNTCHFVEKVVDAIIQCFLKERQKANISISQDNFDMILIDKPRIAVTYEE